MDAVYVSDLTGRIGNVPVYMMGSTAHQLVAARAMDIAPATVNRPAPPVLHHFLDGNFVSGSYPWPIDIEKSRIIIVRIIVGKQGSQLKAIGKSARLEIEKLLDSKVYLELFVHVQKNWTESAHQLKRFGYE